MEKKAAALSKDGVKEAYSNENLSGPGKDCACAVT